MMQHKNEDTAQSHFMVLSYYTRRWVQQFKIPFPVLSLICSLGQIFLFSRKKSRGKGHKEQDKKNGDKKDYHHK